MSSAESFTQSAMRKNEFKQLFLLRGLGSKRLKLLNQFTNEPGHNCSINILHVLPAKTQISLRRCVGWSEFAGRTCTLEGNVLSWYEMHMNILIRVLLLYDPNMRFISVSARTPLFFAFGKPNVPILGKLFSRNVLLFSLSWLIWYPPLPCFKHLQIRVPNRYPRTSSGTILPPGDKPLTTFLYPYKLYRAYKG